MRSHKSTPRFASSFAARSASSSTTPSSARPSARHGRGSRFLRTGPLAAVLPLAIGALASACAVDSEPVTETTAQSQDELLFIDPGVLTSILSAGPAGAAPEYDGTLGFPVLHNDRSIALANARSLLREALVGNQGVLGSSELTWTADTFFRTVEENTPSHRMNVRVVNVYSDAPVYIIGGFALLPDEAGRPADVRGFRTDGSEDSRLETFCKNARSRCIPLSREHVENRSVTAVLLSARSIIVKGVNYTDGLSLVTASEDLVYGDSAAMINLSPRSPFWEPYAGHAPAGGDTNFVLYRKMPNSPEVRIATLDPVSVRGNPDLKWQADRAQAAMGVPSIDRIGFAGNPGGSFVALALRASESIRAQSRGQNGGFGKTGVSATFGACETLPAWSRIGYYCDVPRSNPSLCQTDCGRMDVTNQDGAAGGPPGASGFIRVLFGTRIDGRCGLTEASLRDDAPANDRVRGDGALAYNRTCTNGRADEGTAEADCASAACRNDPHVTACGLSWTTVSAGTQVSFGDRTCEPARSSSGALEQRDSLWVGNGTPGTGGGGGGDGTRLCLARSQANQSLAMRCRSATSGTAGASAQPLPARPTDFSRLSLAVSPRSWAIAYDALHPLELTRRVAVAHQRYRRGEVQSAKTRFFEARSLLEANQARRTNNPVNCTTGVASPSSLPTDLRDVCALRVEVDRYIGQIERGEDYFGYAPNYVVPNDLSSAKLVAWARDELTQASNLVGQVQLGARVQNLANDFRRAWTTQLDDRIAELNATHAPGGSLEIALANAIADEAAAKAEILKLNQTIEDATEKLRLLGKDPERDKVSEVVAKLVVTGVAKGFGAIVPGTDALVKELGKELTSNPYGDPMMTSDEELDRGLTRLGLETERRAALLALREQARAFGRAKREQEHIRAKIAEARASALRLESNKASFFANQHGVGQLDALLKASYQAAASSTRRAAEYVYLAKLAAERDNVPYVVTTAGSTESLLTTVLDQAGHACGAVSSDQVDLRFDNIDCMRGRLLAIDLELAKTRFTTTGNVTRVVPIEPFMLTKSASGADVYRVPVSVGREDLQAAGFGGTRAHQLVDMWTMLDTDAPLGVGTVRMTRGSEDVYWIGATSGVPAGADAISRQISRRGPASGATPGGMLRTIYGDATYDPAPPAQFELCFGPAAANASDLTLNSSRIARCQFAPHTPSAERGVPQHATPYVGRGLIGQYTFEIPANLVRGSSAVRVQFRFRAQAAASAAPAPSTRVATPASWDRVYPDGFYRVLGDPETYKINGSTICRIPAFAGDSVSEAEVRHVPRDATLRQGKTDTGFCGVNNFASTVTRLSNRLHPFALDVRGGAIGTSGALMQLWTPSDNNAAQRFTFNPNGTISTPGGKCLDVQWGNRADGTPVWLWDCHGLEGQQWWLMPDGQIRGMGGKCLTASAGAGSANGAPVVLTTCDPWNSAQRWTPSYEILLLSLGR